jgi:RNA-directed DNA polymerase
MSGERRDPAVCKDSNEMEGKGDMTKAPRSLQDLRRSLYIKAKAESGHRFWGIYVHVCKMETLREAYLMAARNNGAPGVDGVTFKAIEESGVEGFLEQIGNELKTNTYRPMRVRNKEIPKDGGKVRILSIPTIRDRVVQGALKLILEPIFEADFQPGSYGYRPKRTAHQAITRVDLAVVQGKTRVIDLDLQAYFDNVQHYLLLTKVAKRVQDGAVMRLLKMILKATGKKGVPQGGVISPLLSNLYLNEVDRMLEKAIVATRNGRYTRIQYARFADDLVILIDPYSTNLWIVRAVEKRIREEMVKLRVPINEEKSRVTELAEGGSFSFLGFEFRRIRSRNHKWRTRYTPKLKKRTALLAKLREVFRHNVSHPVEWIVQEVNPILRGWVNYFAIGDSSDCFQYVRDWVEKKIRRHLMRSQQRRGFGWKRWSREWLYGCLNLYGDYRIRRPSCLTAPLLSVAT